MPTGKSAALSPGTPVGALISRMRNELCRRMTNTTGARSGRDIDIPNGEPRWVLVYLTTLGILDRRRYDRYDRRK